MRMGAVGLVARGWGVWCGEGRFYGGGFCGIFGGGRRGQMRMAWRTRGGYTGGIEASSDFVVRSEELFFSEELGVRSEELFFVERASLLLRYKHLLSDSVAADWCTAPVTPHS